MQMNIPATFGPICFSGSLEEDWNVYGRTTSDGNRQPIGFREDLKQTFWVTWAINWLFSPFDSLNKNFFKVINLDLEP